MSRIGYRAMVYARKATHQNLLLHTARNTISGTEDALVVTCVMTSIGNDNDAVHLDANSPGLHIPASDGKLYAVI